MRTPLFRLAPIAAAALLTLTAGCAPAFRGPSDPNWSAPLGFPTPGPAYVKLGFRDLAGLSALDAVYVAIDGTVVVKVTGSELRRRELPPDPVAQLALVALPIGRHTVRAGVIYFGEDGQKAYAAELGCERQIDVGPEGVELVVGSYDRPGLNEQAFGIGLQLLAKAPDERRLRVVPPEDPAQDSRAISWDVAPPRDGAQFVRKSPAPRTTRLSRR